MKLLSVRAMGRRNQVVSGARGAPAGRARLTETGQGVRDGAKAALGAPDQLPPDQQCIRRRKCRSRERLRGPAAGAPAKSLAAAQSGDVPAPPVSRDPAHVLAGEKRVDTVGRSPRPGANRVSQGGPAGAVIGGHLEAVGRPDHRRVSPDHDPRRRHVLPLRSQLLVGPVLPGGAPIGREPPTVPDRAIPDLAPGPERDRLNEIPGDRVAGGVVPDRLPRPALLPADGRSPGRRCRPRWRPARRARPRGRGRPSRCCRAGEADPERAAHGADGEEPQRKKPTHRFAGEHGNTDDERRPSSNTTTKFGDRGGGSPVSLFPGLPRSEAPVIRVLSGTAGVAAFFQLGPRRSQSMSTCGGRVATKRIASATSAGRSILAREGNPSR